MGRLYALLRLNCKAGIRSVYSRSGLEVAPIRIAISMVLFLTSDWPSVCGCQAVEKRSFESRFLQSSCQKSERNLRSRSEMMRFGIPHQEWYRQHFPSYILHFETPKLPNAYCVPVSMNDPISTSSYLQLYSSENNAALKISSSVVGHATAHPLSASPPYLLRQVECVYLIRIAFPHKIECGVASLGARGLSLCRTRVCAEESRELSTVRFIHFHTEVSRLEMTAESDDS